MANTLPYEFRPADVPTLKRRRATSMLRSSALPLATFLVLIIPTLVLWWHERSTALDFVQSRVSSYRVRLTRRVELQIEGQLRPLRRLASEMSEGQLNNPAAFVDSARSICREEPAVRFIGWLKLDGQWATVSPTQSVDAADRALANADLDPARPQVKSSTNHIEAFFARLERSSNGTLFSVQRDASHISSSADDVDRLIFLPITEPSREGNATAGALVVCETTEGLIGTVATPDANGPMNLRMEDEQGRLVFANGDQPTSVLSRPPHLSPDVDLVRVLDQAWPMSIHAAAGDRSLRPGADLNAFLISGVIVSLLGAGTVAQAGRHRRRSVEALRVQQDLNEQIRREADAKAVLLRELNHRVKNNLAGIVGLLSADAPDLSPPAQRWLDRAISRIETLARAHELFVGSGDQVSVADLIGKTLAPIWAMKPPGVAIVLDVSGVNEPLGTDQAVTLAMVINELASNALAHGLGDHGMLCIRARRPRGGWVAIDVIDDGTSAADGASAIFAMENSRAGSTGRVKAATAMMTSPPFSASIDPSLQDGHTGIGLSLVRGLVRRELRGVFSLSREPAGGTVATVEFPLV